MQVLFPALLGPALLLQVAAAGEAGAASGLTILKRDLCHSFKIECRRQPPARPAKRPAPKPKPAAKAAKPQPQAQVPAPAVPIPRQKPAHVPKAEPAAEVPVASSEAPPDFASPAPPIPRARPSPLTGPAPETPAQTTETETPPAGTASIPPQTATVSGPSTCAQGLRAARVRFEVLPSTFGAAGCPLADPVRLQAVETPSGTVSFPEGPVFSCRFAQTFARWVSDTGAAVVLAQTGKQLERMATGPGYQCRRRNGDSSGKMSEHAAGDAVDITSMTLAGGTTIRMADAINPASPSYPVLRALRTTACGYFTTVLGPGANEAHREHYHFDLGRHGKSANYRICE
ncbi:extensin family protein [Aestuariivirga litoralis]|uniref:extensin-like domain-containing protein n=1 Tax=Aestuariivirga litoralis TaxID=2650924 RepID=UPI0013798F51|nr:extensin family protein [Aestuariivirga litoralis]